MKTNFDIETKKISFAETLKNHNTIVERKRLKTLQLNICGLCNQVCKHCHVKSGAGKVEVMKQKTMDRVLLLLSKSSSIETVDITGGAPELNPDFRYLIKKIHEVGKEIIDRCNLTILMEPGQEDTAGFLANHGVNIFASLPCYTEKNVNQQRGRGVFAKSVKALRVLNKLGYGLEGTGLNLNLVYNPGGAFLPGNQIELEKDYKNRLKEDHDIYFNRLYTMTNMPINGFSALLKEQKAEADYMRLLIDSFNPKAAEAVMCGELISISPKGMIYDCDFNQALNIPVLSSKNNIWEIESFEDLSGSIAFNDSCYACAAGSGSS